MASQDSLTEYKTILENETQEIVHDFEVFIKSATFLSEFPKLKTFLRLIPIDQNKWTEIYPDEDLDLTQLSGFQFIFGHMIKFPKKPYQFFKELSNLWKKMGKWLLIRLQKFQSAKFSNGSKRASQLKSKL